MTPTEYSRLLAQVLAYRDCGKPLAARTAARHLVRELALEGILDEELGDLAEELDNR